MRGDVLVGERLGRYRLTEVIGRGGMGVVYAALDPELDRKVAVKVLGRSGTSARERLRREAQAMAQLSHPNVVEVFDVGAWDGRIYLAMEFLVGEDLERWMKRGDRPWREVVRVYLAAARGLSAAHAEGILHRDFKPANVILTEDGAVKVVDFGLASERGTASNEGLSTTGPVKPERLTETGLVVGTPAYMAPEQHLGQPSTEQSDQFSYCVALFAALYGRHPYAGHNLEALAVQKTRGELAHVRKGAVPQWLHRVVARGLAPRPADRFEDMRDLVATIERGLSRPGARRRAAAVAGLTVLGAGVLAFATTPRDPACSADEGLDGVWDEARATALETAFAESSLAYAPETAEHVVGLLDAYRSRWISARRELCEGAHALSPAVADRRNHCLDHRREDLAALVEILLEGKPSIVTRAVNAAASLRDVRECDAPSALPDPDATRMEEVARVRRVLARANARFRAGDHVDAHADALGLVPVATATDFEPLIADVEYLAGSSALAVGAYEVAAEHLERAFELANALRYGEIGPRAAMELAVASSFLGRHDEAERWIRHAETAAEWADAPADERGRLELNAAAALQAAGKLEEALGRLEAGRALLLESVGPEHPTQAAVLNSIGAILGTRGELDGALARFEEATRITEATLGKEHPSVVLPLRNVAEVHLHRQQWEEAKAVLRRGLAILERSGKGDTVDAAAVLETLGSAELRTNNNAEAKELLLRALGIRVRLFGQDHSETHAVRVSLGFALLGLDELDAAAEHFTRASFFEPEVPSTSFSIAANALSGLGQAQLRQGKTTEALATLERAVKRGPDLPFDPALAGRTRFGLARALREAGLTDRAQAEAKTALDVLRELGDRAAGDRAEVEAFLTE